MTTRCNAACPMCSRNERGGFQIQGLPEVELSLEDVRRVLPPAFVRQLEQIWLCGNYGDPIIAAETLEVARYFRKTNSRIRIGMNTNGGARKPDWWRQAAGVIDLCHFGIDGLADTNALYRRRTHWKVIMANAAAFIEAGGAATWEYIVFRHNEQQIDEARALAERMGFKRFRLRKTGRFFFGGALQPGLAVRDRKGEEQYRIEPPTDPDLRNTASEELGRLAGPSGDYTDYLDTTDILCKAQCDKEIYVSAEGLVFPCCYLASFYRGSPRKPDSQFAKLLTRHGGRDAINGKTRPVERIVDDGLFQTAIPESWRAPGVSEGRLATCGSTCGTASPTRGQYTRSLI